jgi:NADPH-dependent curcumin reductase CurA
MEGFVVFDYAHRFNEAYAAMGGWLAEGKLKSREQIEDGVDQFPSVLLMLFEGGNFGKLIIRNTDAF